MSKFAFENCENNNRRPEEFPRKVLVRMPQNLKKSPNYFGVYSVTSKQM
jgi:hypothetical protein